MTVYPALVEEGGTVKEGRFSTRPKPSSSIAGACSGC
jgi:Fe-S cluster biogenesis protein NfuA